LRKSIADHYLDYDDLDTEFGRVQTRTRKPKPKRESHGLVRGIVVRARGHHYDVRVLSQDDMPGGEVRLCEVRGRLLQERGKDTLVAVGDYVWLAPHGDHRGQIEQVEERHSVLSRQHPGVAIPAEDVILANPDQVLIVFAAADPEPHLRMLDRFLVIAEANELPAVLCVNKIDLVGLAAACAVFGVYEEIGYRVLYTSAVTGAGLAELADLLAGQVTVLTGPSGVGKSSLLNALHPDLNIQVGDLREYLHKGRHTTRAAHLHALPMAPNTFVADTPGIRELGLYEIEAQSLGFYYREFVPHIHDCHYPNCTHDHEPGCAVRAAVAAGKITAARYESYRRLLHGEE
jgi:ribosome biogenesis GTPase